MRDTCDLQNKSKKQHSTLALKSKRALAMRFTIDVVLPNTNQEIFIPAQLFKIVTQPLTGVTIVKIRKQALLHSTMGRQPDTQSVCFFVSLQAAGSI